MPVSATSTAKPPPPGKAVAAARQGDLRLCVIALLAERSYTRKVCTARHRCRRYLYLCQPVPVYLRA